MIIGNEIIIRQIEIGDEIYLHKWWNDEKLMSHATHNYGTLQSLERVKSLVYEEANKIEMFPLNKRFIVCLKEDLEPIGEVNYNGYDSRDQKVEIGIKICEINMQEKGYGKDTLYHFIDFIFRFLNVNKIELTTMIDNKRAQDLYSKLGFKVIGVIRQAYFDSRIGSFSDVVYMDLLKSEWSEVSNLIQEKNYDV